MLTKHKQRNSKPFAQGGLNEYVCSDVYSTGDTTIISPVLRLLVDKEVGVVSVVTLYNMGQLQ